MLKAYECTVTGTDWTRTVNALTAGKAKYSYFLDVKEAWPDVPYTAVRVRCVGKARSSEMFRHVAKIRGVAWHVGDRVVACGRVGWIAGACSGANFEVHTEDGTVLYEHPSNIKMLAEAQ